MLSIYEARWHFTDVLGSPSDEEKDYIRAIGQRFKGLPLIMDDQSKQDIFESINTVIEQLDKNLFVERQIVLGGGALIGLKYQQLRTLLRSRVCFANLDAVRPCSDLDFLVSPKNFQQLRAGISGGQSIFRRQEGFRASEPRIDRYGIRYPLFIERGDRETALKLEIIADYNLEIDKPETYNDLPCLNLVDRLAAKLMANADRWGDDSTFSRDLIDLAIIANARNSLPKKAYLKSELVYPDAITALKEALIKFQSFPERREKCYEALQISRAELIINGIDYMASKFDLEPTQRTFDETDFSCFRFRVKVKDRIRKLRNYKC